MVTNYEAMLYMQAKFRSLSVQDGKKHFRVYLGKLSKLSSPDCVQFQHQGPQGLVSGN